MFEGLCQLAGEQITLLLGGVSVAGAVVGYFGKGAAFLAHRWWTGARTQERAVLLNSLVDLRSKLVAGGHTWEEVKELEALIRGDGIAGTSAANALLGSAPEGAEQEPESYWSNYAMKARAGARFGVAEAELEAALMDLRLLLAEEEEEYLQDAQCAWVTFRDREMSRAGARYLGGTHAPLAGTLHGIDITERRITELRNEIEDRKAM